MMKLKYICSLYLLVVVLTGCSQEPVNMSKEQITIEQYFYSESEENLKKLSEKLQDEGYGIHNFNSYELEGRIEWHFYSSKDIHLNEIANEDSKSETYAYEYNVGYDGNGIPLE